MYFVIGELTNSACQDKASTSFDWLNNDCFSRGQKKCLLWLADWLLCLHNRNGSFD